MRKRVVFGSTLTGLALATAVALMNLPSYQWGPGDLFRGLSFPNSATVEQDGSTVVSDWGGRRLTRFGPDRTLVWQRQGGERNSGFYTASLLGPASEGGSWVLNSVLNPDTSNAERLELLRLLPDGTLTKPVWQRVVSEEEQLSYNQTPYFFRHRGRWITYFRTDAGGTTEVHQIDPDRQTDVIARTFPDFDGYLLVSAVFDPEAGQGWFLDNMAQITQWSVATGPGQVVFDNHPSTGPAIHFPSQLEPHGANLLLWESKSQVVEVSAAGTRPLFGEAQRRGPVYFTGMTWSPTGKMVLTSEAQNEVIIVDPDHAQEPTLFAGGALSPALVLVHAALWLDVLLIVAGLVGLVVFLYIRVLRNRTPLLFKQLVVLLPLVTITVVGISFWIYQDMFDRYEGEVKNRQLVWSQLGASAIAAADLHQLDFASGTQGEIVHSEAFARLTEALARIVGGNSDPWNKATFDYLYVIAGNKWYVFDQYSYFEPYLPKPVMLEVIKTKTPTFGRYSDAYSTWLSGFSPVLAEDGSVAALLEVTIDSNVFAEVAGRFQMGLVITLILSVLGLVAVTFLSTFLLLRSIRSLQQSAIEISNGNYDVEVKIRSKDEIEDLGTVFNLMSKQIQDYVERVIGLNRANAKFVPSQFLTFLGKDSITEVGLGDQVEKEMTVLFSDIRGFTTISEQMTTAQNFNFINQFLMVMGPQIRTRNGFIDKYIGDAIMALFPASPEDALRAALAMFQALDEFHRTPGLVVPEEGVQIGVGIHTGRLMLGIIGEAERFDGTVISDSVNLASRLESLTKFYGASILISGQTLGKIADRSFFESRLLDRVQVKGKTEVVEIHEVLVPNTPGFSEKLSHRAEFEKVLQKYFHGDFVRAREGFEALSQAGGEDQALAVFLSRMKRWGTPPQGWTGVSLLDSK